MSDTAFYGVSIMGENTKRSARATRIAVDLKDLHSPWMTWCTSRGLVPSDAVRRVLRRVIEGANNSEALPYPEDYAEGAGSDRRRLEIRLTAAEHAALTVVADREGMSLPRWLTGLVRLHLTGEQQFGGDEVAALARSSQVLLALGRNINQIARNINQRSEGDELTLAQIEHLAGLIKTHTLSVAAVLNANSRRWRR